MKESRTYTFRELVDVLCLIGCVDEGNKATFISRIMQLQRLHFPDRVNVGRGIKMKYSATHVCQIALAFEMFAAGLPPRVVLDTIRSSWHTFDENEFELSANNVLREERTYRREFMILTPRLEDFSLYEGYDVELENECGLIEIICNRNRIVKRNGVIIIRLQNSSKDVSFSQETRIINFKAAAQG